MRYLRDELAPLTDWSTLTINDVAELLGVGRDTVFELVNHPDPKKRLPSIRIGARCRRIRVLDYKEWLETYEPEFEDDEVICYQLAG